MTQFRERNPIPIAIIGIVVVLGVIALFLKGPALFGGGRTIHAYFAEDSNLQKSDDVRIAGIKVGQVQSIKLATIPEKGVPTQVVEVTMHVDGGIAVNDRSTAAIKIKTLLGSMYVDILPAGTTKLTKPIDTTGDPNATPLVVTAAFQQLSQNIATTDTTQLAQAFSVLSADFANTSGSVSSSLKGLAAVSETISSRDQALQTLLTHANGVSAALASRDQQVTQLIDDGQTVLTLLNQQRDVIHNLLLDTSALSQQITALVAENRATLKPALDNIQAVTAILSKDQTGLDQSIHVLAPFVRDFTNTLGNGQWFDSVIQNLGDTTDHNCFTVAVGAGPTQRVGTGAEGASCQ